VTGTPLSGETTLGELGELGVVAEVVARFPATSHALLGPGDDAAVVAAPDGRVVVTTDVLVEGRHFRRDWSSAVDVGRKAAAQNLADVVAMGAVPTALLVALAAPPTTPLAWVRGLADGLREEAAAVGCGVVGGDITAAETIVVAVTALGDLAGLAPVTRAGARVGDQVAVCGRLGWAEAGLAVLTRGFRSPRSLVDAHRRPSPPYDAGPEAARLGATALIDVSDGLLSEAAHVARASGVRLDLRAAALTPDDELVAMARALGADPDAWVRTGGDDHALLGCFPPDLQLPARWRALGTVRDGAGVSLDGMPVDGAGGYRHYG
jgi:thiamine-monophosphate kinase